MMKAQVPGSKQQVIDPLRNLDQFMNDNNFSNSQVSTKQLEDDIEVSRVDTTYDEESKGDSSQLQIDNEDDKREIMMEFGGREISHVSPDIRGNNNDLSDEEDDDYGNEAKQDQDPNFNMKDLAIMHMAKKNLSFELEYIQIVCQSLNGIKGSNQFSEFSKKMEDDPLNALSSAEESKGGGVRFALDQTP